MSVEDHLLLHPELLSDEQLRNIIKDRYLKLPQLENMPREAMLQIFHQYCVPYAQRQYRDSGRGKMLNKNRSSTDSSPNKSCFSLKNTQKFNSTCRERLQPPPDTLAGDVKRIKISNGPQRTHYTESCTKRKVEYMETSAAMNGRPPEKKSKKMITWP